MQQRPLGPFQVSAIGLGCMNLSHAYGAPPPDEHGVALIHRALDRGVNFFDTAALYGFGVNETLVGKALKAQRSQVTLASKCGLHGVDGKRVVDGRPATLKWSCEQSLKRLGTEVIDLFYLHRWDKQVPIEDSVGAMSDLVREGKVRALGLSEVSAATLKRAHAVHPIVALQTEYSLWTRNPEIAVLEACREMGATFVAFSPVARGFLSNTPPDPARFAPSDIRRSMPRFDATNWPANLALLPGLQALAAQSRCTVSQLALAWLLAKAPHIVPIPGTSSITHLEEDLGAAAVTLSPEVIARAEALVNPRTVRGGRYDAAAQAGVDTEEFA